jgi:protein-disulfide isomerase-like protein with CxxC motif
MTTEGIRQMHQALGMYMHQALEESSARKRERAEHQQQVEILMQQVEAQGTDPTVPPSEAPDVIDGPVPIKAASSRRAGG